MRSSFLVVGFLALLTLACRAGDEEPERVPRLPPKAASPPKATSAPPSLPVSAEPLPEPRSFPNAADRKEFRDRVAQIRQDIAKVNTCKLSVECSSSEVLTPSGSASFYYPEGESAFVRRLLADFPQAVYCHAPPRPIGWHEVCRSGCSFDDKCVPVCAQVYFPPQDARGRPREGRVTNGAGRP